MKLKHLLFGIASWIPGVYGLLAKGTGGTGSARYCYSVWLRHLVNAQREGEAPPRVVAELGPGDSLGIGLAALISGVERYQAFDVVEYASGEENLRIFDELVELFRCREPIPGDEEFPRVRPKLESYAFPHHLLDERRLEEALDPRRLERLREELRTLPPGGAVRYVVPWDGDGVVEARSVDLIVSQAVLEYVDGLEEAYRTLAAWLRPGGRASLTIDYTAHHVDPRWNAHWCYPGWLWRLLRGGQPYWLNRRPHSAHLALLRAGGLRLLREERTRREPAVERARLARPFRELSDEDFTTSGGYFLVDRPE